MIDFKNTIILLTRNAGSELIMNMCKDPELLPDPESLATAHGRAAAEDLPAGAARAAGRRFRTTRCPTRCSARSSGCSSNRIKKRVAENHKIPFEYSDDAVKLIVKRCNNAESGGRIIDAILTNTVLPKISIEYLHAQRPRASELKAVRLGVADDDFTYAFE